MGDMLSGTPAMGFPMTGLQNPMAALSGFGNPADFSASSFAKPAPAGVPGIPGMGDMMGGMFSSPMTWLMMGAGIIPQFFLWNMIMGKADHTLNRFAPGGGSELQQLNNNVEKPAGFFSKTRPAGQLLRGVGAVSGAVMSGHGLYDVATSKDGSALGVAEAAGGAGLAAGSAASAGWLGSASAAVALPVALAVGGTAAVIDGHKRGTTGGVVESAVGGGVAGGVIFGAIAGAVAGSWTGPGAIITGIIGAIVGGAAGFGIGMWGKSEKDSERKHTVQDLKKQFEAKAAQSGIDSKLDKYNQLRSPGAENLPASNFAQDFAKEVEKLSPEEQVKAYTNAIAGLPARGQQLDQAVQQMGMQQNLAAQMEESQKMQKQLKRMIRFGGFGGFSGLGSMYNLLGSSLTGSLGGGLGFSPFNMAA